MAGKSKIPESEIRRLHAAGTHPAEIAKQLGVHYSTIVMSLAKLGLEWEKKKGGKAETAPDVQALIISRYTAGEGATLLAREYGVDKKTVYNLLNSRGLGTRSVASRRVEAPVKDYKMSPRDLEIALGFADSPDMHAIAARLGISVDTVRYSLRKQGMFTPDEKNLAVRQAEREYVPTGYVHDPTLRRDAFDGYDEATVYWKGFLLADGHIHDNPTNGQDRLFCQLQRGDRDHLTLLKAFLGTWTEIIDGEHESYGKMHPHSVLSWTCDPHAVRLRESGILSRKEGRFVPASLAGLPAFWRGLVDGDGSIYPPADGGPRVYLSGTIRIVTAWSAWCEKIAACKDVVTIDARKGCFVGTVRFRDASKIILHTLYRGASVYLPRKYEEARQCSPA